MTATYRDAKPGDAAAIDHIFRTSFCDTFAHLYRSTDLEAFLRSFTAERWERDLTDGDVVFRIAEVEGSPVGYAKLAPLKLPVHPGGPALLLDQIYLLKEHHGAGIARELMEWTIAEAGHRGAEELYLTVYTENERARRLYERYGFEAVGRYDFMVGRHADEDIIMMKRL